AQRVANYLNVSLSELKTFARITGHSDLHELSVDDLVTINREISEYTNIRHA
ncbi:MAG TPA: FMN-binding glutamate synthase family protein, partial [Lachnospiraceae bacterium]|nr:FMN-binding glutamate synthase family protein [Lachnospiraceae bacterium]